MFGKDSKKKELISNLGEIYHKIEKEHQISPGDFPNLAKMQVRFKKSAVCTVCDVPSCPIQRYRCDEKTTLLCYIKCSV